MKFVVPDLATVPKLLIRSYLVIPTPESWIDKVLDSSSYEMSILNSLFSPRASGSETDKNLSLEI